ncbi:MULTISPECIES: HpcH/HpaI aldolase/citrate lyase family protein [Halorussus]|uniref:HpcH/HpaI aldolase family protein n=1 Tax=Halorussus TaxID=1070314 RepID=UPI000E20CDC2|nr:MULTISPECIES: aldolase/citrate lyase family protein [Halorussus]NHN59326.1 2-dehydro-3-deoxyglucarate aldolase [Halorussus sp. JP-T4]
MTPNDTLRTLDAGDPALGAWLTSMSPRVAEVIAATDVDWVGVDAEHSPISTQRVESVLRAVEGSATPIVRLQSVEAAVAGGAKRVLDAGAQGVMVPGVETPDEAESVVRASKFPPEGTRGVAGTTRANDYGASFDEYVAETNDETLIVVQLETPDAVARADEILAVDGVDVGFVGENDLSAALGTPGEKDRREVREAVETVREAAAGNDVAPGIAARSPENLGERTDRGFRFFLLGADLKFVRSGVEDFLTE